jgi:hypothetical protein
VSRGADSDGEPRHDARGSEEDGAGSDVGDGGPQTGSRQPPGGSTDAPFCDLCGSPMRETHCKLVCDQCGYMRDCSDP